MEKFIITKEKVEKFALHLKSEERSKATIEKYLREIRQYMDWMPNDSVTKDTVGCWKTYLVEQGCAPATINGKLAALNALFRFLGWKSCQVKSLRLQRRLFRDQSKELTKQEYERLLQAAMEKGKTRLALLIETICATGIRVSEVPFINLEAVWKGKVQISLKGKIRTILLPGKLCHKLKKYARQQKIVSGEIFLTRDGTSLSRKQIWAEMKSIAQSAGVASSKVFPHNLRHLFAQCFYRVCRDIAKLADVLGHSSIETTRVYLISTGKEHARILDQLQLVS